MLHIVAFLLAAVASDPAAEVRDRETAFAKAFAGRDAAKFASFLADDAKFMSAKRTLSGKAEVMAVWSEYMNAAGDALFGRTLCAPTGRGAEPAPSSTVPGAPVCGQ